MVCPKCGQEIIDTKDFCVNCGQRLTKQRKVSLFKKWNKRVSKPHIGLNP